jgi:hypothetical protein
MNHRYIDESSVAERYLEHTLAPDEQDEFEAHLIGCEECIDRLLLAQIFLDQRRPRSAQPGRWNENGAERRAHGTDKRNGASGGAHPIPQEPGMVIAIPPNLPWPARFVAQFKPWQLALILAVGAALLLMAPTAYYFWELAKLQGTH